MDFLKNMTAQDVQRYVRIVLQWLAATLVTRGMVSADATWVQPVIGFVVGFASLLWTLYGNRFAAKVAEIGKFDGTSVVTDAKTAAIVNAANPDSTVVSNKEAQVNLK